MNILKSNMKMFPSIKELTIMKKKSILTTALSIAMAFVLMFSPMSVGAVKADATSIKSQVTAAVKTKKPAKVTSLSATSTTDSVTLKWGKVKNATGYRVYQKKGSEWKAVKTVNAKTTSLTVKSLKASTEYSFKVRAYTKAGAINLWGDSSKVIKCKTKAVTKVSITSTSSTKNSVTLKWGKIAGATGYRVYQKKDGKWVKLADVTSCSYTVKKLKASTSYTFCVKAYKTANKKTTWYEASKAVTVKTTSDVDKIVSAYNTALNNAKKLKKGTIIQKDDLELKCVDCSASSIRNLLDKLLDDFSGESETNTYNLAVDKANEILPPYGKNAALNAKNVASATEKISNGTTTLSITLKSETSVYDGKGASVAVGNSSVTNTMNLAELDITPAKINAAQIIYPATQLTATLDSNGKLTKLVIRVPLTMSMEAELAVAIAATVTGSFTDTYTIKY